MFRYFAILWNPKDEQSLMTAGLARRQLLAADSSWKTACNLDGMEVLCAGASRQNGDALQISDGGVLLGTMFDSSSFKGITHLSPAMASSIRETKGRSLVDRIWGSYVAFIKDQDGCSAMVVRGPLSTLPCFWTSLRNTTLVFSLVEDCISLRMCEFSINWDCIRAQSAGGDYLCGETAINELCTLITGEALQVRDRTRVLHTYWSPSSLPRASVFDFDEAKDLLRDTTIRCVGSWLSNHRRVLVQLSGGFDSSVVLACARYGSPETELVAANFWSRGSGDERHFARGVAEQHGVELLEYQRNTTLDFRSFLTCARTGNPPTSFTAFESEPILVELARQRSATAVLTGEIGDDIFGHASFAGMICESLETFGFGPQFLSVALDYAELRRVSLWRAISQAISYRRWRRAAPYWSLHRFKQFVGYSRAQDFLTDDALEMCEQASARFIHPWLKDTRDIPDSRTMLIWSLAQATSTWFHSPFGGSGAGLFTSPLVSQPLIEAHCQIPVQLHFRGAENGAVGRSAFRSMIPDSILGRGTGKGTPDLWIRDLITVNRPFLRDFLCGGMLAEERILDRSKLELALGSEVRKSQVGTVELITLMYVEAWLRRWNDAEVRAVA